MRGSISGSTLKTTGNYLFFNRFGAYRVHFFLEGYERDWSLRPTRRQGFWTRDLPPLSRTGRG